MKYYIEEKVQATTICNSMNKYYKDNFEEKREKVREGKKFYML